MDRLNRTALLAIAGFLLLAAIAAAVALSLGTDDRRDSAAASTEAAQEFIDADARTVDAGDAFRLARRWASEHRRSGERLVGPLICNEVARLVDLDPKTEEAFECRVRFQGRSGHRRTTRLDMRSFNDSLNLRVVQARLCEDRKPPCDKTPGA